MPAIHKGMLWHILLVAVIALVLAGCASSPSSEQSESSEATQSESTAESKTEAVSSEGFKQDDTLTVGLRMDRGAPYVIEESSTTDEDESEGSSSAIVGLDVELGCALADELGLDVSLKSVSNVSEALGSTCDVVINVTSDEAQGFDVVGSYAQDATAFFHKGEAAVVSVDNLKGKTIGLQEGSSAQMSLHLTSLEVTERTFSTVSEAFDALDEGEVDYVLCGASSGAYLSSWREGIAFAGALSAPTGQGIGIASGDGSVQKAIREAYEAIQENGVLAEIRRSWLGSLPELTSESVIANIPMRETSGEALESTSASSEVLDSAMDGSTAGANAVTLSEVSTTTGSSASASGTTDTASGTGYADYGNTGYSEYTSESTYTDYGYADTTYTDTTYSDTGYTDYSVSSNETGTTDYGYAGDYTETY